MVHFYPHPQPPKDGGFFREVDKIFGALGQVFQRCRQKMKPSASIFQRVFLRGLDFQSSLRVGVDKKRIDCPQILSLAAHVFLTCAKICFYSFVI